MRQFLVNKILFIAFFSIISLISYRYYVTNYKYYEIFKNYRDSVNNSNTSDIILFGSSVENHIDLKSESTYRISEILDTLTNKKVKHISNPGFSMPIYYSFVKSISMSNDIQPITFIIPINMRSFSNTWYGSRYNQFRDIDFALSIEIFQNKEYVNFNQKHKITNGCADELTYEQFMSGFFLNSEDNELERCVYFNFKIKPDNYVLKYIDKILKFNRDQITLYFYFEPLDYSNLSQIEKDSLDENILFIKDMLKMANVNYIDLSRSLNSDLFDYKFSVNEHTKQYGKYLTAKFLKDSLL